jgi:opacity protein-like surface antigen
MMAAKAVGGAVQCLDAPPQHRTRGGSSTNPSLIAAGNANLEPLMSHLFLLRLAGLIVACGACGAASAQDRPWYMSLDAGISRASDPAFAGGRLTTRQGAAYGGAIGRQFGPDWRIEAALMYRGHPVRQVSSPGFDAQPGDADWASLLVTVNVLHDFAAFKWGPANVRPYVGLGVGRAQEVDADLTAGGAEREFSGSARATQVMAGLRWDYGSPWTADIGVTLADAGRIRLAATGGGASVEARYRATTVLARLGYRF